MSTRAFMPLLCLTLAACQSQNPYTDESAPIPPAPPVEQIQAPTYPAAPRLPATSTELAQPASGYGFDQR